MENVQVSLVGFLGEQVSTVRTICLPVYVECVSQMVKFMVVYCEKLWIHAMKVVPYTYHQVIQFLRKEESDKFK